MDPSLKKLDFRKTEKMNTFLNGQYSEENVKKIMKFYFNDCDLKSKKIGLENIVHVSTFIIT